MGKQINSAKKMENNSKESQDNLSRKESKKIDDYFNLGNRKRQRDDSQTIKEDGVLKTSSKSDNVLNNIVPIPKGLSNDFKSIYYMKIFRKISK